MTAEQLVGQGRTEDAVECFRQAMEKADDAFKKSYVAGELALVLNWSGRFEEALQTLKEALHQAETCSFFPHIERFHAELAGLYCHLGRFAESEPHFQRLLEMLKERGQEEAWFRHTQNLGMACLEQAKYAQALELFDSAKKHYEKNGNAFDQALAKMQLAQVYSFLGMATAGQTEMKAVQASLHREEGVFLMPYWNMLEGKFELIQGHLAAAFHSFEAAAREFEKNGDLNGKVEVLLSISGPLLELNLIRQAQQLLGQVTSWSDLSRYPALEHAVRLRRLALGAFSGQEAGQDMDILRLESAGIGRTEDWLQFWLHLSLAARKLGQAELMGDFLQQAKRIAFRILQDLGEEQKYHFLRRPDIARLWRLNEGAVPQEGLKVRAKKSLPEEGPADAGIFAPPRREK